MLHLNKFEEIEVFFSRPINSQNFINTNNLNNEIKFISLHIINLIGLLQYDKAYQLAKDTIKNYYDKSTNYLYQIYVEYFYIGIYREYIFIDNKNNKFSSNLEQRTEKISKELIDVLKSLISQMVQVKKTIKDNYLDGLNDKGNMVAKKELENIYKKNFEINELNFSLSKNSKSLTNFNLVVIDKIIVKIVKLFALLCTHLIKLPNIQNYEHIKVLKSKLSEIIATTIDDPVFLSSMDEDALFYDKLFIQAINSFINQNNNVDIEENLKQVIIHDSTNLEAIKLLIAQLLKTGDLSNTYVFCNKALKINDKERGMWALMADYYQKNKDDNKFYECTMKELTNSSKHRISLLYDNLDISL